MLLNIFLGLIAMLTLVFGDCDFGSQGTDNYDYPKLANNQPWYVLLYTQNDFDNTLDCVVVNFGSADGNIKLVNVQARLVNDNRYVTINGNITNWNSTGLEAKYPPPSNWNGWFNVFSNDYDQYKILKHCSVASNTGNVYVFFRNRHPDISTVVEALKVLQKFNIDFNQFVEWPVDQCQ